MKKTFSFNAPNKTPERQSDSIKKEVKKYIARERRKTLPEDIDFWDFDCKIGESVESAQTIHEKEINKSIDALFEQKKDSFYLEILVKPGLRKKKSQ